ncbi:hypothetical protein IQ225_13375 [Synechocystis salina LEGE 06155]|nr:hypothetical protein [Synechocystis salina LEGE 06155]
MFTLRACVFVVLEKFMSGGRSVLQSLLGTDGFWAVFQGDPAIAYNILNARW